MCIQETRLHAICNHAAVDRIECSEKCSHFDSVEIQLSTYCQSCRQQVDNTAILNSVLRWKLGPCPARRRKIRPAKADALDGPPAPGQAPAKPSPRPARKLSGAKSLSALREAASAPPTRELPPTPKRLKGSTSVENLAASLGGLGLASPAVNTPGPRYSLDVKPAPPTVLPLRRRASEAFEYAAGGDGQARLARAHTIPKSKARPAVPQRPAPRTPSRDTSCTEKLKSPRPSPQQVRQEPRPKYTVMARDTDTDTTISTRPSTATTTDTVITATSTSTGTSTAMTTPTAAASTRTSTNEARKSALVQQPSYPPPPPPPQHQQQQQQETQQPPAVSASVPRSLWSLRRSRSSARILALVSTREYVHSKLCGNGGGGGAGMPSPSAPGKNLFPAPQQKKKPIDIHDPEWLARHGLKWDARGLGLVSAAV